jgi:hypothetical protein
MLSLFFRVFEKDSDSLGFEPRLLFLLSFRFSGNKDSSGGKRIFVVFSISSIYPFLGFKKTKGINNPLRFMANWLERFFVFGLISRFKFFLAAHESVARKSP